MLQASRHQGDPFYSCNGRQCVANAVHAIKKSYETPPSSWTKAIFDSILQKGNDLYEAIIMESSGSIRYLSFEDIPSNIDGFHTGVSSSVHGTIDRVVSEKPFLTLQDAFINRGERTSEGYLFSVGKSHPSYTSAVFLSTDGKYYFIDSHSRSQTGMAIPEGLACVTVHHNLIDLCTFIQNLSISIFGTKENIPFEVAKVTFDNDCDSDSEFSGFEIMSDGEYSCQLYIGNELMKQAQIIDSPSVSDASSIASDNLLDKSLLSDTIMGLDDSNMFIDSIDFDSFSESDNYDDDDMLDKDYNPSENSDSSEDLPLALYIKKRNNKHSISHVSHERNGNDQVNAVGRDGDSSGGQKGGVGCLVDVVGKDGDSISTGGQKRVGDNFSKKFGRGEECSGGQERGGDALGDQGNKMNGLGNTVSRDGDSSGGQKRAGVSSGKVVSRDKDCGEGQERVGNGFSNVVSKDGHLYDTENGGLERSEVSTCIGSDLNRDEGKCTDGQEGNEFSVSVQRRDEGGSRGQGRVINALDYVQEDFSPNLARGRKRKRNSESWKRNVAKLRKNSGKSYISNVSGKLVERKVIGLGCSFSCRYKCHSKFNKEDRENIFHEYWQLGDITLQRNFIGKYALRRPKKRSTTSTASRQHSIFWSLPCSNENSVAQVCKTFFLQTLAISEQSVVTVHKKQGLLGICSKDERGCHFNRPNKTKDEEINLVIDHINSFSTVESHYCRRDSNKKYLQPGLTLRKMYTLYLEKVVEGSPVSFGIYRKIFDEKFNLGFFKPIKDRCDFCVAFENATSEEKDKLRETYDKHLQNKEKARQEKEKDKFQVINKADLVVSCFDLQEVLLTPHSNESCLYYKRRLNNFNFTIYDLGSKNGYSFLWNESTAGRGANEIASCLFSFIKQKAEEGKKQFIFFSDNCSAQNKNKHYLAMLWYCVQKFKLESITHKYLVKGHTQSECDSMHATIEYASKNITIFTTPQWAATIRAARHKSPYTVKEMAVADFFDMKSLQNSLKIKNFL